MYEVERKLHEENNKIHYFKREDSSIFGVFQIEFDETSEGYEKAKMKDLFEKIEFTSKDDNEIFVVVEGEFKYKKFSYICLWCYGAWHGRLTGIDNKVRLLWQPFFIELLGRFVELKHRIQLTKICRGDKQMDTALLILDIQKDFVGEKARMPVLKHQIIPMIEGINTIIDKCNKEKIMIVYVGNEFEKKKFISNWFRNNAALKGSLGAELDDRLEIVNDLYFSKNQSDALSNLKLLNYLKNNLIKHLLIVGLFVEGCVTATAKGALHRNFKVTIIRDAVASASNKKRDQSLQKLASRGISVVYLSELSLN